MVCRTPDSRNIVPSYRTGTSSEIRNDNLQVTVDKKLGKFNMNRITSEMLRVYLKYNGDIDMFARIGRKRERQLCEPNDWDVIDDFFQRLEMIEKGLCSAEFKKKTLAEIKKITDTAAYNLLTKNLNL